MSCSKQVYYFLSFALIFGQSNFVFAQNRVTNLMTQSAGLHHVWSTHVQLNRNQSRLENVVVFASLRHSTTAYVVTGLYGTETFSEVDLDDFGEPVGNVRAVKLADRKMLRLETLGEKPFLETIEVPRVTLYALTTRGVIHAIDGESGRSVWAIKVGNSRYPNFGPAVSEDRIALINGSTLFILSRETGKLLSEHAIKGVPTAAPSVNDRYVFYPTLKGTVIGVDLTGDRKSLWKFQAHGHTMVAPTFTPDTISWPNSSGMLYVGGATEPGIRFRLEGDAPIVSAAVFEGPSTLFATATDGSVYAFDERDGQLAWRFSAGEPITQSAFVRYGTVYAVGDRVGLFAIDGNTGEELWTMTGIAQVLSATGKKVYCLGQRNQLLVLNAADGFPLARVSTNSFDMPVRNSHTDRVYLAEQGGAIVCLRDQDTVWPAVYRYQPPKEKGEGIDAVEDDAAEPTDVFEEDETSLPDGGNDDSPEDTDDPFGEDPFGGDEEGDPFGEEDDPFS